MIRVWYFLSRVTSCWERVDITYLWISYIRVHTGLVTVFLNKELTYH